MTNEELARNVSAELEWDPKVDEREIAVSADDGKVALRGTVGSLRQKHNARKATERVYGVTSVDNDLQVRLLTHDRRDDAELRGDVLRALALDSTIPSTVDATVEDGYVTLTGTAEWQFQREEAESVAGRVRGVLDVWNDLELTLPTPDPIDVKTSITSALERNTKLDADGLAVTSSNGTVTLEGVVTSWAAHDDAIDTAWAAPGVRKVEDRILVAY